MPFPGSPLDFQSRALLSFEKIDPDKDVAISFGPFAQSVQRLLAGQLDAAALPEPLATHGGEKKRPAAPGAVFRRLGAFHGRRRAVPAGEPLRHGGLRAGSRGDHRVRCLSAWDAASRRVTAAPSAAASQFAAALAVEPGILEEAARNTLLSVPSPAENKARVLAYYEIVSRYFPAGPRPLDERFFFGP